MKGLEIYRDSYDPHDDDWEFKTNNDWKSKTEESSVEDLSRVQVDELVRRVNSITLKKEVAPTATGAIQLHIFNFLLRRPEATDEDIQAEFSKIQRLSEKEKEAADINNPLPTIGIEIEIPQDYLTNRKIEILDRFYVSNTEETDDLWEVNPDYSYTAEVQARIIQELRHLGALPIDSSSGKVLDLVPLSLHVNFGMPTGILRTVLDKYQDEIILINDLLTYGFTSESRIIRRKTKNSFLFTGSVVESDKSKYSQDGYSKQGGYLPRVELRAGEFKDYPTFRMLSESQKLMAMFSSHVKIKEKLQGGTIVEESLADLWSEFKDEALIFLACEGAGINDADNDIRGMIDTLRYTDIRKKSRSIISDYARKVSKIIEEGPNH